MIYLEKLDSNQSARIGKSRSEVFLEISQNSQENTCARVSFLIKLQAQAQPCNFTKKETLAQVFSCEFFEISKNTFSYRTLPVTAFPECAVQITLPGPKKCFQGFVSVSCNKKWALVLFSLCQFLFCQVSLKNDLELKILFRMVQFLYLILALYHTSISSTLFPKTVYRLSLEKSIST